MTAAARPNALWATAWANVYAFQSRRARESGMDTTALRPRLLHGRRGQHTLDELEVLRGCLVSSELAKDGSDIEARHPIRGIVPERGLEMLQRLLQPFLASVGALATGQAVHRAPIGAKA